MQIFTESVLTTIISDTYNVHKACWLQSAVNVVFQSNYMYETWPHN